MAGVCLCGRGCCGESLKQRTPIAAGPGKSGLAVSSHPAGPRLSRPGRAVDRAPADPKREQRHPAGAVCGALMALSRQEAARPASSLLEERGLDCRGNVDRHESICREEIVLAALVDDAKIAIPLGVFVGQDRVDFVALEGRFVPVVADADGEPRVRGRFASSRGTACA